ncbi:MAG: OsmC family protein [Acidobacteriota bacterium]|nr:OsmC family protein [Acidobacteriota bacterium]
MVAVDLLPNDGGASDGFRSAELLLAALGACTAGTVRSFAVNQSIEGFEGIDIIVNGETAKGPERVSQIDVDVHIRGDISESDLERLMRVGSRCKVHNTLHSDPEVNVRLVSPTSLGD